ncbi:MAG: DNA polymerase III subunit gamma/tau, partial [Fretibacterium sp.]|nr:DNA polymerase III subunit gamma/tau [Fretibacterium sp.]
MAVSLYRQYRPQTFAEVVGQDAAIDVLSHSLSSGRIGHAYLFSGPRGCGKTSVARILAKALNCTAPDGNEPCGKCPNCLAITAGESLDVVEIDGASNNSVDEVRELKSHVTLAPFSSKYKVYIIDEVHMLSMAAFNALLKTLEEPPSYVVFILATTEPHKVPVTIRSRCQHIPFHSIGARRIFEQLTRVCEWEKVAAQPEALWEVARQADGAMRDALSMLEQVINRAASEVTLADVEATLGAGSRPALERWLAGLREAGPASYTGLKEMFEGGSPQRVFEELFSLVRNLWLTARWPDVAESLDVSEQEKAFLQKEAPRWKPDELRSLLASLVNLITQARQGVRSDVLVGLLMLALGQTAELTRRDSVAAFGRSGRPDNSATARRQACGVELVGCVEAGVSAYGDLAVRGAVASRRLDQTDDQPEPALNVQPAPRRRPKSETLQPEPLPPVAEALPTKAEEAPQPSAAPALNWQPV